MLVVVSVTAPKKVTLLSLRHSSRLCFYFDVIFIDVGKAWLHGCLLLVIVGLLNVSMRYIYSNMIPLFGRVRDCKFASGVGVLATFRVMCVISFSGLLRNVMGSVLFRLYSRVFCLT
ncbi:hypothetical protein RDI58_008715 [Solanum bulbocastanum]|uniref:Uncharacterized protein n=1 Tax=Solanum bulbocastanum TaxID=147425 RepID=A0AAN8U3W1_SOLBU